MVSSLMLLLQKSVQSVVLCRTFGFQREEIQRNTLRGVNERTKRRRETAFIAMVLRCEGVSYTANIFRANAHLRLSTRDVLVLRAIRTCYEEYSIRRSRVPSGARLARLYAPPPRMMFFFFFFSFSSSFARTPASTSVRNKSSISLLAFSISCAAHFVSSALLPIFSNIRSASSLPLL